MTALQLHPLVLLAFAYLALSVVFQFRPLSSRYLLLDSLGILPRWKFFLQQDEVPDVRIVLRDGELGAWQPVRIYPHRQVANWLWFPDAHRAAIVWLAMYRLAMRMCRGTGEGATETVAHLTLLRYVQAVARAQHVATFQFALIASAHAPDSAERTLFVSSLHQV